jgi:beta-glucanase (GH16 family)
MKKLFPLLAFYLLFLACSSNVNEKVSLECCTDQPSTVLVIHQDQFILGSTGKSFEFDLDVPITGRYRISIFTSNASDALVWVEDYRKNQDERVYDLTGKITLDGTLATGFVDGSPLAQGLHPMRIHIAQGDAIIDSLHFELLAQHQTTPTILTQNMKGDNWTLVWSDEFDYVGLPDDTKWNYNFGNWGWGNNELQYYTKADSKNVWVADSYATITALRDESNPNLWTSARLTTQSKVAFTYGKIEFRAKVPAGRGTWSAGWTLGDEYIDELSWPYCGEIDVLEAVGFEIDDSTGAGRNHASCHTRAYYFKQNNQITASIPVENISNAFHTYAIEWYPDSIIATVDGQHYYTYDKTADEFEWPFHRPQAIIINLAMGGGWGGAKGIDPEITEQKLFIDYVRVYAKE